MKKLWLLLTVLIVSFLPSCNREGPVNVTGADPNDEVLWKVRDYDQNPGVQIYTVYLPANWCPASDSLRPWIMYTIDGVKQPTYYLNSESIKFPDKGYENYFKVEFWVAKGAESIIFLKYGLFDCLCGGTNVAAVCDQSAYAVYYDVTRDKNQAEYILAFKVGHGKLAPIDKSLIRPIRARVVKPAVVKLNENNEFWLDQLEYTLASGIKEIRWKFPDNRTYYGWHVTLRPELAGTTQVFVTDNFNKTETITFSY